MIRKKLIAGNWKMNKTSSDAVSLAREIVFSAGKQPNVDVVICPPFTALESVATAIDGSLVKLGAQNMHFEDSGAFTGEISAPMLRALFATHVILGHSERRTLFGETDEFVNKKVLSALKNQLRPILCVGESLAEREAGTTLKVVQVQTERALDGVSKELAVNIVDRLRARLGHRHRKGRHGRAGPGGPRVHPRAPDQALRRARGPAHPHPLRRVDEAGQRRGTARPEGHRRRPDRGREPRGPQFCRAGQGRGGGPLTEKGVG